MDAGEGGRNSRGVGVGSPGIIRPRLLSVPEAARYLGGISVWTVRALAWRGEIPEVRIGRRLLFDVQDLDSLVERSKWSHGPTR
jgi:excisionase family DNA binding protein